MEMEVNSMKMEDAIKEVEELEDFELEEQKPEYQVWLLGDDENYDAVPYDYLIDSFDSPQEAIKCGEFFSDKDNLKLLKERDANFAIPDYVAVIEVRVETVVQTGPDSEENIDTIYEDSFEVQD